MDDCVGPGLIPAGSPLRTVSLRYSTGWPRRILPETGLAARPSVLPTQSDSTRPPHDCTSGSDVVG